jgi:hypothetical protein
MEFSRIWKVRTVIVLVIFGALGTIKKGLDHNQHYMEDLAPK